MQSVANFPTVMLTSRVEAAVRLPHVLPFSLAQYPRTEVEEIQGACSTLRFVW